MSNRHHRVLLFAEQLRSKVPGGIGTHTEALLRNIANISHEFPTLSLEIVVSKGSELSIGSEVPIPIRYLPLSHRVLVKLSELKVPIMRNGGNVHHSFSMMIPPVADTGPRSVVTIHDLVFVSHPEFYTPRGVSWHSRQLERVCRTKQTVVAVSEKTRVDLVRAGVANERIHVIESGSDHMTLPDFDGCKKLLSKSGVSGRYILSVSTIEPRKNLAGLIEAYRLAKEQVQNIPELVVVGPEGWGKTLGVAQGVHLLGSVPEPILAALYRGAEILAYVPFEEGFGLPVVEAMAHEIPVVSSDIPAAAKATQIVDPMSVVSISDAIITVLSDPSLRDTLVKNGIRRAEKLTWEKSARSHMKLWESLA